MKAMKKRRCIINSIKAFVLKNRDLNELKRYKKEYRRELGYYYAQAGRLIISSYDVRELFRGAGYKVCNYSDNKLWQMYCDATGDAIDEILS